MRPLMLSERDQAWRDRVWAILVDREQRIRAYVEEHSSGLPFDVRNIRAHWVNARFDAAHGDYLGAFKHVAFFVLELVSWALILWPLAFGAKLLRFIGSITRIAKIGRALAATRLGGMFARFFGPVGRWIQRAWSRIVRGCFVEGTEVVLAGQGGAGVVDAAGYFGHFVVATIVGVGLAGHRLANRRKKKKAVPKPLLNSLTHEQRDQAFATLAKKGEDILNPIDEGVLGALSHAPSPKPSPTSTGRSPKSLKTEAGPRCLRSRQSPETHRRRSSPRRFLAGVKSVSRGPCGFG